MGFTTLEIFLRDKVASVRRILSDSVLEKIVYKAGTIPEIHPALVV